MTQGMPECCLVDLHRVIMQVFTVQAMLTSHQHTGTLLSKQQQYMWAACVVRQVLSI